MKRYILFSVLVAFVVSLAAPYGAVFASENVAVGDAMEDQQLATQSTVASNPISFSEEPSADATLELVTEEDTTTSPEVTSVALEEEVDTGDELVSLVPTSPQKKALVLSYIQASGVYGKYVEIRNVSDADYFTRSLSLLYIRANGSNVNNPDVLATFYGTIKSGGMVSVGNNVVEQSATQHADFYYGASASTVMDVAGGRLLLVEDAVEHDSFCWSSLVSPACGEEEAYIPKNDDINTTYTRCFDEFMSVVACKEYADGTRDMYKGEVHRLATAGGGFTPFHNACSNLIVSEVAPRVLDQFIELHNPTNVPIALEACVLQINTRTYQFTYLDGYVEPQGYRAFVPDALGVSLARTTAGAVRILSSSAEVVDVLTYTSPPEYKSAVRDVDGTVVWTLDLTPSMQNTYRQYAPCDEDYWRNEETGRCNKLSEESALADCGEGRERNPATGRCRNIASTSTLTPCKEGQYRSEETNRCRSIATAASTLKPCADDQFRNPETNRCKKIASSDDVALADCGEGRERNPATNRCRAIQAGVIPEADFAVEPIADTTSTFVGWWALGGVGLLAVGYAGWEWRREVSSGIRKVGSFFTSKK